MESFRVVRGFCLGQVSSGMFLNASVVPRDTASSTTALWSAKVSYAKVAELVGQIRINFVKALRGVGKTDASRGSIQKNSLTDPSRFNVLEQDQRFILGLLDQAMREADTDPQLTFMLTLSMFGQKSQESLDLSKIVRLDHIKCTSVHFALTLVPDSETDVHVMWSRLGLEEWVGDRGYMYPVLSMAEAANFQSNLDGRKPDVCRDLLKVLFGGEEKRGELNFVQVYTDSPHTRMKIPYKHPVSGVIATCNMIHHEVRRSMYGRALDYLDHMVDLQVKFQKSLDCRIEQVRRFAGEDHPSVLRPEDIFGMAELWEELRKKPLLLPFIEHSNTGLMSVLCETIAFLVNVLRTNYAQHQGKGGYEASWQTYQAELALEELLHGHPLSPIDHKYSWVLGTSAGNRKSLTFLRGYLGLAEWSSASSGVTPPPLDNWTTDPSTCACIRRMFQFCESQHASPADVGSAMWVALLGDLFKWIDPPLEDLKAAKPPFAAKVAGAISPDVLIDNVTKKRAFPFPKIFDQVKEVVKQHGGDPVNLLHLGLQNLQLRWVPLIKMWETKNPRGSWDGNTYVEIFSKDRPLQSVTREAVVMGNILTEFQRRGLVFSSKCEKYRERGFPWLDKCIRRIPAQLLTTKEELTVLVFLSCIGLLENNQFVDFKALQLLLKDLPISIARMQELLLMSKFILNIGGPFRLWKLHETLPTRLTLATAPAPAAVKKQQMNPQQEEQQLNQDVQATTVEEEEPGKVRKHIPRYIPPNCRLKWRGEEIDLISLEKEVTHRQAYMTYVRSCEENRLPARTMTAFIQMRRKVMK
ncbi:uncharacterized protein V6R79_007891 [Siganus canaliculatus]